MKKTIAQRELRNQSGKVLREAEAGQEFVITVGGRPVAELGPYRKRSWVSRQRVHDIFDATPCDAGWGDDIRALERDDEMRDPFAS